MPALQRSNSYGWPHVPKSSKGFQRQNATVEARSVAHQFTHLPALHVSPFVKQPRIELWLLHSST